MELEQRVLLRFQLLEERVKSLHHRLANTLKILKRWKVNGYATSDIALADTVRSVNLLKCRRQTLP